MQPRPTPAEIVILASGAAALVFSFLEWFTFDGGPNAWDRFLFPTYTLVAICGAAMALLVGLELGGVRLPARGVAGFGWPQVHMALAVYTALLTLSFLILEKGGADLGIGFIVSLLAAAGLVVGAILLYRERLATGGVRAVAALPPPPPAPPQPPPPQQVPPPQPPPQQPPPQ